jgi:hypothetical protein
VLDIDIADVPKDEWHGTARTSDLLFNIIPCISIPIDSACAIAVYIDSFSTNNEPSMMILKGNRIRVVSPVVRHLNTTISTHGL